jgi:hypothetical protein
LLRREANAWVHPIAAGQLDGDSTLSLTQDFRRARPNESQSADRQTPYQWLG